MSDYKLTVGIEVHAELTTKSKMFCGCKNDPHASEPNQNTCPVCLAHPGTLPTVNKEAVKKVLMVGNAVGGDLADFSEFDRKNYFYPDIPKAYQLSQYKYPFVKGGELAGVQLRRIHLEEDTAKSLHDQGEGSVVDFNRAGVPLMELVTEPVIHDPEKAGEFVKELQLLLRTIGVSNANMEKGEMRVEANISISKTDELGTLTEVKNLNSFKSMVAAIEYEMKRQAEVLDAGGTLIQETRGWDENKGKTFPQRTKETAEDYRYFPDPDIPKFDISEIDNFSVSRLDEITPKLATEKRIEYTGLGITADKIEILVSSPELDAFFTRLLELQDFSKEKAVLAVNYLTTDIAKILNDGDEVDTLSKSDPQLFSDLIRLLLDEKINSRAAKNLLIPVLANGEEPESFAKNKGLLQLSSAEELQPFVDKVCKDNPDTVAEFKAGKEASLKFLVGQGMKASGGSINPALFSDLLEKHINSL